MAPPLLSLRTDQKKEKEIQRMDNTKVISTLNSLIETLKDGEEGFRYLPPRA